MRRLRYTKIALLIFGLGLIAGLVVVGGEFSAWERAASAVMALGLVLIPLALFADGRGMALVAWIAARFARGNRPKPRARPSTKPRAPTKPRGKSPAPKTTRPARKPRARVAKSPSR